MTIKNKAKKVSKLPPKQKGRKIPLLRKDTKKTKLKVENLNKEGSDIAEIVRLSAVGVIRRATCSLNTLENKSLQSDWKKDKRIQEKANAKKQEIADKLEKQIESISSFSL
ncbi:hypothetical protein HG536_0B00240 [Torulaspora globosa]|uniref:Uncharacterized protein n=1 Tax=Torulaspora globosa TaxID=48254 RepID=A0A7G3ZCC7_9SACH|nr:uncharacterized protein HG536_0B00240 [Torulaspora globosa]QLL31163.1 hypothetical protein HG536_0B00240 [Torulaspora globosa]